MGNLAPLGLLHREDGDRVRGGFRTGQAKLLIPEKPGEPD
jgi:hypothetical protein